MLKGAGNYILEFKLNEKCWGGGLMLQRKMALWDILLTIQEALKIHNLC